MENIKRSESPSTLLSIIWLVNILLSNVLVINYGEGMLQNGEIVGPKLFAPPPPSQDKVELFSSPNLKGGYFLRPPPFRMTKTSSYPVKTTP